MTTKAKRRAFDVSALKAWAREHRDMALTVVKARAFAEVERERVNAYVVPIFQRYGFTDDMFDDRPKRVLTDPKDLYLSEDEERCKEFYAECDRAHREHGYKGEAGTCPALVAEDILVKCENLLLAELGEFIGVDGFYTLELRRKALDHALRCALNMED